MTPERPYPDLVCESCGSRFGQTPLAARSGTWHVGKCGVCNANAAVSDPRDFGGLKPEWQTYKPPFQPSATELLERLYPVSKRVSDALLATGIDFTRKNSAMKTLDNETFARVVQARLNQYGHSLKVDGHAGPATSRAFHAALPDKAPAPPVPAAPVAPGEFSKRTMESLAGLNKKARARLEVFLAEAIRHAVDRHGVTIEVISGFRSPEQQTALYAQGRTKPGSIVTNAKAWQSWHNYGLAIDLGLFRAGKYLDSSAPKLAAQIYAELGAIAAAHGIEWAGTWKTFKEGPHFQFTGGITQAEAKKRYLAGGVQKVL